MDEYNKTRDEFWEIDKLVPKKKTVMHPFASTSQVSLHEIGGEQESNSDQRRLTVTRPTEHSKAEEHSYVPVSHSLIKRVTIKRSADKFDFYGNFRKAALVYYDYKTQKCDFVPYYSYMPQYTQLTSEQKAYYFYWRDEIRRGKFIKCDYSYLYLYVYEILNLPDKLPPEQGVELLCLLWRRYRDQLPRIDSYFAVWIQDYCLVHGLSCPMDKLRDFIFEVIRSSDFKEFYLSDITVAGKDGTAAMIAYLSDYDPRHTKYAQDEKAEIFRNHMLGAMGGVVEKYCSHTYGAQDADHSVIRRDAFPHSLCTHAVKCKLEIEYVQISKNDELRRLMTAATRYTENKLRALFGVKSRLGIKDMDEGAKRLIDGYFDNIFEIERLRRQRENAPEYEKLYDAEREKLSFADADEIERASWFTTARLVAESDEEEELVRTVAENNVSGDASEFAKGGFGEFISGRHAQDYKFAPCRGEDDSVGGSENNSAPRYVKVDSPNGEAEPACTASQNNSIAVNSTSEHAEINSTGPAEACGVPGLCADDIRLLQKLVSGDAANVSDEAFERINEAFQSTEIGDVVLEYSDDGYILIEDYIDDVRALISGR